MSNLVEVVVDNLTEINKSILLDLNLSVHVDLYTGGVHNTEITNEVLTILANDHQLRLPELLIIGDLVVVSLAFSNLEDTLSAIERDLEALKLFGVNSLKFHMKLVRSGLVRNGLKGAALKVDGDIEVAR